MTGTKQLMKKNREMTIGAASVCVIWVCFATSAPGEEAVRWFKGNTHTHTLWSDGNDFPDMVAAWYKDHGYQFLGLSDHNVLSRDPDRWVSEEKVRKRMRRLGKPPVQKYLDRFDGEWVDVRERDGVKETRLKTLAEVRSKLEVPGAFLLVEAEEITAGAKSEAGRPIAVHINAVHLGERIPPMTGATVRETLQKNYRAIRAHEKELGRPVMAHLNHPNFAGAVSPEDVAHVLEQQFIEVYNGHPGVRHLGDDYLPGEERIWDIANTIRVAELEAPPLYGVATDDSHTYHGGNVSPGRGWVMVRAGELTAGALIGAMRAGAFYASSGVELQGVTFDAGSRTLRVEIVGEPGVKYTTRFIGTPEDFDPTTTEIPGRPGDGYGSRTHYSKDIGKVFATAQGTDVRYTLDGGELFVRATVTASKPHPNPSFEGQREQAWTQPVGWR